MAYIAFFHNLQAVANSSVSGLQCDRRESHLLYGCFAFERLTFHVCLDDHIIVKGDDMTWQSVGIRLWHVGNTGEFQRFGKRLKMLWTGK